jgi:hypothetical protein
MYKNKTFLGLGDATTDAIVGTLVTVAKGYAMTKCPLLVSSGGITDDKIKQAILAAVLAGKPLNTDTANSVIDGLCGANEKKTIPQDAVVGGGTTTGSNNKYYYIAAIVGASLIMYFAFKK